jgi:hypothetical protein
VHSYPDQWGFWEWLGQTPRLVQGLKLSYYYSAKARSHGRTRKLSTQSAALLKAHGKQNMNMGMVNSVTTLAVRHAYYFYYYGTGSLLRSAQ